MAASTSGPSRRLAAAAAAALQGNGRAGMARQVWAKLQHHPYVVFAQELLQQFTGWQFKAAQTDNKFTAQTPCRLGKTSKTMRPPLLLLPNKTQVGRYAGM
jgi:hypothetical protein